MTTPGGKDQLQAVGSTLDLDHGAASGLAGWAALLHGMARFLLVLKPSGEESSNAAVLIDGLQAVLEALQAELDHRTPAHLSALLRQGSEGLPVQLFADVQAKADGNVLELALMSREPMGKGAPLTRAAFERLVAACGQHLPQLALVFRSDRDGALPA